MDVSGSFSNKPTPVRKPTIIKVPSKTGLSEFNGFILLRVFFVHILEEYFRHIEIIDYK